MIKLFGVWPAPGLPDVSTFVIKVDCYLRMVELPYTLDSLLGDNTTNSIARLASGDLTPRPRGKFPYIEDGGTVVGDSSFIIEYLKATYGDRLGDDALPPEQRAIALSMRRMIEEHLYWVIVYAFWTEEALWAEHKRLVFGRSSNADVEAAKDSVLRDLYGQGLGRHARSEVYALGNADLSAISAFLGDKPYALGEKPTALDATVYGFLSRIVWCPHEYPMKAHARTLPNLEAYCGRMRTQYY